MKLFRNQKGFAPLIIILGLLLILIIIAGLWYFYNLASVSSKPRSHSVISFDKKSTEFIAVNDTITGRGIPNSSIQLHLTPGDTKAEIKTDKNGSWFYQVPKDFKKGKYRLTIEILDKNKKLVEIKSYKVEIVDSNTFKNKVSELFQKPQIDEAKAQGNFQFSEYDPEYRKWARMMRSLDMYPHIENGEVVFYDRDTFMNNFCNSSGCVFEAPSSAEVISSASGLYGVVVDLRSELVGQCYDADIIIADYFPGALNLNSQFPNWQQLPQLTNPGSCSNGLDPNISEDDLAHNIQQVYNQRGYTAADYGNPIRVAISITDPIVSTRTFVNWGSADEEERLNALAAVGLMVFPGDKILSSLGRETEIIMSKAAVDTAAFKTAMREGEGVPLSVALSRSRYWGEAVRYANAGYMGYIPVTRGVFPKRSALVGPLNHLLDSANLLISSGRAAVMNQGEAYRLVNEYENGLRNYYRSVGREFVEVPINFTLADDVAGKNRIIVVNSNDMRQHAGMDAAGLQNLRLIFLDSQTQDYRSTVFHELAHYEGETYARTERNAGRGVYFGYGQNHGNGKITADYGALMSEWYELGADLVRNKLTGSEGPYATLFPLRNRAMNKLIQAIRQRCNYDCLEEVDFIDFARTMDDSRLMEKVLKYISVADFETITNSYIDPRILNKMYADWSQQLPNRIKYPKINNVGTKRDLTWVPLATAGGTALTVFAILAARAHAEELTPIPEDANLIFAFPDEDVDISAANANSPPYDVVITEVDGTVAPGSNIDVSAICSQDGVALDPAQCSETYVIKPTGTSVGSQSSCNYEQKSVEYGDCASNGGQRCYNDYYLDQSTNCQLVPLDPHYHCEANPSCNSTSFNFSIPKVSAQEPDPNLPDSINQVTALPGGSNCHGDCTVTLPANLQPGTYNLFAYLTRPGSDQVLDGDSYPLAITLNVNSSTQVCKDEEFEFAGCDPNACGKEVWKCTKTGETRSGIDNPGGDCSKNSACKSLGPDLSTSRFTDSEGNKIPFFSIQLGSDETGTNARTLEEAKARLAEMQDFNQSLDDLLASVTDPRVSDLIKKSQGKLSQGLNACIAQ